MSLNVTIPIQSAKLHKSIIIFAVFINLSISIEPDISRTKTILFDLKLYKKIYYIFLTFSGQFILEKQIKNNTLSPI